MTQAISNRSGEIQRGASIDIGSNSIKLWVAEGEGEGFPGTLDEQIEITGLGEQLEERNLLPPPAMRRSVDVVRKFANRARELNAEKIIAGATSAVRRASNSSMFRHRIKKECDLEVKVISGKEEAILTFIGSTYGRGDPSSQRKNKFATLDVGGGSTEICVGKEARPTSHQSLPIGSIKFYEKQGWKGRIPKQEFTNAIRGASQSISGYGREMQRQIQHGKCQPIGIGGTVATIAQVLQNLSDFDREAIEGFILDFEDAKELGKEMAEVPPDHRVKEFYIREGRKEYIMGGLAVVLGLMRFYNLEELMCTTRGLRHGLLLGALIS